MTIGFQPEDADSEEEPGFVGKSQYLLPEDPQGWHLPLSDIPLRGGVGGWEQPHSDSCCEKVALAWRSKAELWGFWLLHWSLLQLWPLQVWTRGNQLWICPGLLDSPKLGVCE